MGQKNTSVPLRGLFLRLRPLFRLIKGFRGSPEAVAGGFALGLFLALTPTVGVQIIVAIFLATLFKLSRPAALISVMITNPVTVPPIFTFNYWVGSLFFDGPSVREVYGYFIKITGQMARLDFWEVGAQLKIFFLASGEMLLPLVFGSLVVAVIASLLSYILLVRFLWFLKLRKERKIQLLKIRKEKRKSFPADG